MNKVKILWADDEIDYLKISIHFLQEKGYEVITANNGYDAVEICQQQNLDIVFLDMNMPGISGLETLSRIKAKHPNLPVVMITKSEEEEIMDEAVGLKIDDYLIKPVKPNQILLSLKKNVHQRNLVTQKTTSDYQKEFSQLGMLINDARNWNDWTEVYKKLVFWELQLNASSDNTMDEVLSMQKNEANQAFGKFVQRNYLNWFNDTEKERPITSQTLLRQKLFPMLETGKKVILIVIDNLRFDQWKILEPQIVENFTVQDESLYCAILPTATQYARNAMFSGLMPSEIEKLYPGLWQDEDDEGSKNQYEEELLLRQMLRLGKKIRTGYFKVNTSKDGRRISDLLSHMSQNDFSVVIHNFIDILSHARTEMDMLRELAADEAAYRSLTLTWYQHSPLREMIQELASRDATVVITTDHGSIRVTNPVKIIGDKTTNTNLRYKQGKNLNFNPKEVFEINKPAKACLPNSNLSTSYVFTANTDFFVYPNNYNHFVKYYKNTFQHGGISLEEMMIPFIVLQPR